MRLDRKAIDIRRVNPEFAEEENSRKGNGGRKALAVFGLGMSLLAGILGGISSAMDKVTSSGDRRLY